MKFVAPICVAAAAVLTFTACAAAQETKPAEAAGQEVTIIGNVISNVHTGEKEQKVYLMALDGTPEIKKEFDAIIEKFYPEKGLDGDAALEKEFDARLRYCVDGPDVAKLNKAVQWTGRNLYSLTGMISEKDGNKWITESKYSEAEGPSSPGRHHRRHGTPGRADGHGPGRS